MLKHQYEFEVDLSFIVFVFHKSLLDMDVAT